jgi:hypothetical protein
MTVWESAEPDLRAKRRHSGVAALVFAFDRVMRRRQGVFEYTSHPSCVFRLQISRSTHGRVLRDGTALLPGQRLAQLHYWTEQMPPIPPSGPTIASGRALHRGIQISLAELARFLRSRPDLGDIQVVFGDVPSGGVEKFDQIGRIMARYGFEVIAEPDALTLKQKLQRWGENVFISLIVAARSIGALHLNTLRRVRVPIYLSRRALEQHFGAPA